MGLLDWIISYTFVAICKPVGRGGATGALASPTDPRGPYGVHLRTKIIENKMQFEVQKLDYPCRNLVI